MRSRVIRSLLTLCLGAALVSPAGAQVKRERKYKDPDFAEPPGWALGVNFGLSDLWGDVGTKSPIDHYKNDKYWGSPKFMGGIYARYRVVPALALRIGVNHGTLYASDNFNYSKAKKATNMEEDAVQRYVRNQDVKSIMWEGQLMVEINPYRFNVISHLASKKFQPYIMLGVGGYHFQPKISYRNRATNLEKWQNAYDLHLEGQGFANYPLAQPQYSRWQMNIPMGLGVRWEIGKQLGLGVEYIYRYCLTDYLDNVSGFYVDPALFNSNLKPKEAAIARDAYDKSWIISPDYKHGAGELRGNPADKDAYSTLSINFYYKIKSRKTPWWY